MSYHGQIEASNFRLGNQLVVGYTIVLNNLRMGISVRRRHESAIHETLVSWEDATTQGHYFGIGWFEKTIFRATGYRYEFSTSSMKIYVRANAPQYHIDKPQQYQLDIIKHFTCPQITLDATYVRIESSQNHNVVWGDKWG